MNREDFRSRSFSGVSTPCAYRGEVNAVMTLSEACGHGLGTGGLALRMDAGTRADFVENYGGQSFPSRVTGQPVDGLVKQPTSSLGMSEAIE